MGKHEPQNASGHRQERGLDQHLASELRRPRAERRSNRELASPRRAPREHQAGEIGRDGHDEERDAASEEPQRPADRAEKLVREAMHVGRRRLRGFRVLLPQSLLRRLHFLLQGIRGRPGPEPRKGSDEIVPALGAPRIAAQVEGNEDLPLEVREGPRGRQDAHDLVRLAVQDQRLANGGRIGAEPPPPQVVRDDGYLARLLLRFEHAARRGHDAEQRKPVRLHPHARDPLRLSFARQRRVPLRAGDEVGGPGRRLVVEEVRDGEERLVAIDPAGPDPDEALRVAEGERFQEDRLEESADRRRDRDGQREKEDRRRGEGRRPQEPSQRLLCHDSTVSYEIRSNHFSGC